MDSPVRTHLVVRCEYFVRAPPINRTPFTSRALLTEVSQIHTWVYTYIGRQLDGNHVADCHVVAHIK